MKPLDRKGKGKMTAEAHAASETKGHTDEVLALALSSDGKYLVSGGRDRRLAVWDAETHTWIRSFGGHRDIISVCCFHLTLPLDVRADLMRRHKRRCPSEKERTNYIQVHSIER